MEACVITTFRCNLKCHMCNIWANPTFVGEEITAEVYDKLPSDLNRLNITGGEPALRDDLEDVVRVLNKKSRLLELSTNGFFTEKIVELANKFPGLAVRVSLEGPEELNDRLCGIKGGYKNAVATVTRLRKAGLKNVGFSTVICDENAGELKTIYDLASGLGAEFSNSAMHNSWYFHKTDNSLKDTAKTIREIKSFLASLLRSKRKQPGLRIKDWLRAYFGVEILRYLNGISSQNMKCQAATNFFTLDPSGNVIACTGSREKLIMGNLKKQEFDEIWNGPKAREVRKSVSECNQNCAFVFNVRSEIKKNPMKPIFWIIKNKIRLALGREIDFGENA